MGYMCLFFTVRSFLAVNQLILMGGVFLFCFFFPRFALYITGGVPDRKLYFRHIPTLFYLWRDDVLFCLFVEMRRRGENKCTKKAMPFVKRQVGVYSILYIGEWHHKRWRFDTSINNPLIIPINQLSQLR